MSLCSDINSINTINSQKNYEDYYTYTQQKLKLYNEWKNYFDKYDSNASDGNSLNLANQQLEVYRNLKEPITRPLVDLSKCTTLDSIYLGVNSEVIAPQNYNNYRFYTDYSYKSNIPMRTIITDPDSCYNICNVNKNCLAYDYNTNSLICNLYSNGQKEFTNTPGQNLYIKQYEITQAPTSPPTQTPTSPTESPSNMDLGTAEIAGISVGVIIVIILFILAVYLYIRFKKARAQ